MMDVDIDRSNDTTDNMAQNIESIHNLSVSTESTISDRSTVAAISVENLNLSVSSSEAEVEDGDLRICRYCSKPRDAPSVSNARTRTLSLASSLSSFDDEDIYRIVSDIIMDHEARQEENEQLPQQNFEHVERILMDRARGVPIEAPLYPHRPLRFMECEVCLSAIHLRRRICCDYKICDECLDTYIALKVSEAKIQVECPNDRCNVLIHCDEIKLRLSEELREKFLKFLVDANADPCVKTCPGCSIVHNIDPDVLVERTKLKRGLKVKCRQCKLEWCFLCQAPFHKDLSCKQFKKGDEMVRRWAKERFYGQSNAQRCPKCKIFIQKAHGCDHMKCNQCNTDFCYSCGDRYIQVKFLGSHWSRFSVFGCRYTLLPKKPVLRRLIRGANLACRVVGCTLMGGIVLAFGAVVVAAGVVILPGYGIVQLKRHMRYKRHQRRLRARASEVMSRFAATQATSSTTNEESEVELPDRHQVEVMVHRALSQEAEADLAQMGAAASAHRCECYINHFTADSETVMGLADPPVGHQADGGGGHVTVLSDVKEVPNKGGYSTVVANIVSRVVEGACGSVNDNSSSSEEDGNQVLDDPEISEMSVSKNHTFDAENEDIPSEMEKICPYSTFKPTSVSEKQRAAEDMNSDSNSKTDERHSKKTPKKDVLNSEDHPAMDEKLPRKVSKKDGEDFPAMPDTTRAEDSNSDQNSKHCSDTGVPKGLRKISLEGKTEETEKNTEEIKLGKQSIMSKDNPNGCFGNIFSKRSNTFTPDESIISVKNSNPGKFSNRKAATWEKIRLNRLDTTAKLSPHDTPGESSPVILTGQRSSSVVSTSSSGRNEFSLETRNESGIVPDKAVRFRGRGHEANKGHVQNREDKVEATSEVPQYMVAEKSHSLIDASGYPLSQTSITTYL